MATPLEKARKDPESMKAIHHFISGENFFRPMVGLKREDYIALAKETLKFILIPSFVEREKRRKVV